MTGTSIVLRLRHDHRTVLERLDALRCVVRRARSTTPAAKGAAVRAADALVTFLAERLPAHFALEERELPAPVAPGDDEHAALAAALEALAATRGAWRRSLASDDELLDHALRFADRLERHIREEERQLAAWIVG